MPSPESEDRKLLLLELAAASAIFSMTVFVLYVMFSYRPA